MIGLQVLLESVHIDVFPVSKKRLILEGIWSIFFAVTDGKGGEVLPQLEKNYEWFLDDSISLLNQPVSTVVEVGARDCLDSLFVFDRLRPDNYYAFEPSHPGILASISSLQAYSKNNSLVSKIRFMPFALSSHNGLARFYEYSYSSDKSEPNIGASSMYKWTTRYHRDNDPDKGLENRAQVHTEYDVPVFRADNLSFLHECETIDLLLLDCEGSEMDVLLGFGDLLNKVESVCLETGYHMPRDGLSHNALDIVQFLQAQDFQLIKCKETGQSSLPVDNGHVQHFDLFFSKKR